MKIGEYLVKEGLIANEQLDEALELQKINDCRLGEVLVDKGVIDDLTLTEMLARLYQLPFMRLKDQHIDQNVLNIISPELMQTYKVLPVKLEGNNLTLATNNPLDVGALQDIQYKCGYTIYPVMASLRDINGTIKEHFDTLLDVNAVNQTKVVQSAETAVTNLVDTIIRKAIKENASDIHLEPQRDNMRVRFRIDGVLYERSPIDKMLERNVLSRIKIISGMDVAESRRPQDGRTSFSNGYEEYDLRIATLPTQIGENMVLRILTKTFVNRDFSTLGMEERDSKVLENLMHRPYGLILVTGPTGAGKTTSLYSMLNKLNQTSKNIISVEEPIEYEIKGINQTSVNNMLGYTFSTSIRHILRHDPDIIMIGEIRDVETAETAIRAALTGHLVLATMHTNTASGAITRLLEMDIEPFLVSSAVCGVMAQRLTRKLCLHCKKSFVPDEAMMESIKKEMGTIEFKELCKATGCEACSYTGFSGREAIYEIVSVNDEIRALILKNATEKELLDAATRNGMKTLKMAGMSKVVEKKTSLEEILHITSIDT